MNPTIVLLAAGMSTRYGRLKQLEPVGPKGEALLDYAVFDARRAGFSRVVLIIREELEETFRAHIQPRWPSDLDVVFHHQRLDDLPGFPGPGPELTEAGAPPEGRRKPWGTGHALLTARDRLPDPFVLLNADDFYGPSAFAQGLALLGRELRGDPSSPPAFGLVAYTLEDTLTRHGGVTRGICTVDRKGWLEGVEEAFNVRREGPSITGVTQSGERMALSGQEPTSTNFWIFTPEIFPLLEEGFAAFMSALQTLDREDAAPSEPEFLIPMEVNRMVAGEQARVWVLRTHDPFFGITHPQDWEWVVTGIRDLIREGSYPDPLWGGVPGPDAT
jgi:hypothetical protein